MRIFSGIRPTGGLHIGNYLGAIKQWIALQETNECVFCIVDLHAITTPYEPKELQKNILETTAVYLAAESSVAEDIAKHILSAADQIDSLRSRLEPTMTPDD